MQFYTRNILEKDDENMTASTGFNASQKLADQAISIRQ